ncbi:MAG: hypothetical protein KH208_15280 [Desulfovibrio sp.]|uniref:hypothetical protein n=1 Tax=Desulfovibrio sp. TaxID=885 RepID=UPI0025C417D6|nr:hypothetical protein [Desulfovibrio sp.]MBS6831184.1 hypothetical protein [Desulfovibrio sp.]
MQNIPLTDDQCAVVRNILKSVLDALREAGGRYDVGDRVVMNLVVDLSLGEVGRLRRALKKL